MRVLLLGHELKSIDLSHELDGLCSRLTTELTAEPLADVEFCVFDYLDGIGPEQHASDLRHNVDGSSAAAIIIPYSGGDWVATVDSMPARIQSLVPRLTQGAAISISKDALLSVLPFQDTVDPIQDALIRLVVGNPGSHFLVSDMRLSTADTTQRLPKLAPGMSPGASESMTQHLSRFVPEELEPVQSVEDAVALTAGLFLMHDCLERSHSLSQDVQGEGRHVAGDYWHAIMHRREPDYENSKYWYRRVGRHPVFDNLARQAAEEFSSSEDSEAAAWSDRICGGGEWNAFAWVDFCEEVANKEDSALHAIARRIQWHEMLLLLRQTAHDAYGDV